MTTFPDSSPPDCQAIDFRAECNPPSTGMVQVPAHAPAPAQPVPAPHAAAQVPAQPSTPAPQHPAPIDHFMPPHDWHQPSWSLHVPSVHQVLDGGLALGAGGALAAVAGVGLVRVARHNGLEPRQMVAAAASSYALPAASIVISGSWTAPLHLLIEAAHAASMGGGYLVGALAAASITAIPAGWTAAAVWWSRQREREKDGRAKSAKHSMRLQRRHEAAKARAGRNAAKTAVPYVSGFPLPSHVVLGVCSKRTSATPDTMWSSLFSRHDQRLGIPLSALDEHLFALGGTGSGKTTMLLRLAVALFQADWQRHLAGGPRPLHVFLDAGGDKKTAKQWLEVMGRIGIQPDRILSWPDQGSLDLFAGPAEEVTETLQKMVCPTPPSDSAQEYFFKSRRRVIRLAMGTAEHDGPDVPAPRSRRELFVRLSSNDALKKLYPVDTAIRDEIDGFKTTKPPMVPSVGGILRDAWDTLGPALDTGKPLSAYDAIFLRVPGTTMKDAARSQAAALLEMLLKFAARGDHGRRIRALMDELAAVNDEGADIGVVEFMERARKYDASIVVAAQNVEGIAPTPEKAKRLMKAASGGAILMRGRGAGDACELFGTTPKPENTRHTLTGDLGDEGSEGLSDTFLVSPEALDEMQKGDAVYVNQRLAIWGHVTPIDMRDLPKIELTEDTTLPPVPDARTRPLNPVPPVIDDPIDDDDAPDLGEAAS